MSDRWTFGCGVSLRRGRSDGFVSEIACAAFGDVDARPVVAGDVTSASCAPVLSGFADLVDGIAPRAGGGRVRRVDLHHALSGLGGDVFQFFQLAAVPELDASCRIERGKFLHGDEFAGVGMVSDVVRVPPVQQGFDAVHLIPEVERLFVESPPFGVGYHLLRVARVVWPLPWHEPVELLQTPLVLDIQLLQHGLLAACVDAGYEFSAHRPVVGESRPADATMPVGVQVEADDVAHLVHTLFAGFWFEDDDIPCHAVPVPP